MGILMLASAATCNDLKIGRYLGIKQRMLVCEALPTELCEKVWSFLPLRTRATATKAAYEENYHALVHKIPRIGDYAIRLARDSSAAYVFKLLFDHRQAEWVSLGRWKQWTGKYTGNYNDYFSFLRHVCRESGNHRCLSIVQEAQPGPIRSGTRNMRAQRRPKHIKQKRQEW